jgi:hypothetical protein
LRWLTIVASVEFDAVVLVSMLVVIPPGEPRNEVDLIPVGIPVSNDSPQVGRWCCV